MNDIPMFYRSRELVAQYNAGLLTGREMVAIWRVLSGRNA